MKRERTKTNINITSSPSDLLLLGFGKFLEEKELRVEFINKIEGLSFRYYDSIELQAVEFEYRTDVQQIAWQVDIDTVLLGTFIPSASSSFLVEGRGTKITPDDALRKLDYLSPSVQLFKMGDTTMVSLSLKFPRKHRSVDFERAFEGLRDVLRHLDSLGIIDARVASDVKIDNLHPDFDMSVEQGGIEPVETIEARFARPDELQVLDFAIENWDRYSEDAQAAIAQRIEALSEQILFSREPLAPEARTAIELAIKDIHDNPRGIRQDTNLEKALNKLQRNGRQGVHFHELTTLVKDSADRERTERSVRMLVSNLREKLEPHGYTIVRESVYRISPFNMATDE